MPEWLKGMSCNLIGFCLRWFKSSSAHFFVCFIRTWTRVTLTQARTKPPVSKAPVIKGSRAYFLRALELKP